MPREDPGGGGERAGGAGESCHRPAPALAQRGDTASPRLSRGRDRPPPPQHGPAGGPRDGKVAEGYPQGGWNSSIVRLAGVTDPPPGMCVTVNVAASPDCKVTSEMEIPIQVGSGSISFRSMYVRSSSACHSMAW